MHIRVDSVSADSDEAMFLQPCAAHTAAKGSLVAQNQQSVDLAVEPDKDPATQQQGTTSDLKQGVSPAAEPNNIVQVCETAESQVCDIAGSEQVRLLHPA